MMYVPAADAGFPAKARPWNVWGYASSGLRDLFNGFEGAGTYILNLLVGGDAWLVLACSSGILNTHLWKSPTRWCVNKTLSCL